MTSNQTDYKDQLEQQGREFLLELLAQADEISENILALTDVELAASKLQKLSR